MKYINNYNVHLDYQELNEKAGFWRWLAKSRKGADLFSMKKAIKIATEIAKLEYEKEERNRVMRKRDDVDPVDVEHELATYSKKIDNLRHIAELKYGKSPFLTELIEERIAELKDELYTKRLRESRRRNDTKDDKQHLKELQKSYKQESQARQNQLKQNMDTNFDFDSYEAKMRKKKFDEEMRQTQMERQVIACTICICI